MRLLALAVLLCPALVWAGVPVAEAHADLAKLPPAARCYYRYLTLSTRTPVERELAYRVYSGHANGLSVESDISPLTVVPGTAGALLRVNIQDYGWNAATWEKLTDADPYYHLTVTVQESKHYPQGLWHGGQFYAPGYWNYGPKKDVRATAPWIAEGPAAAQMKELIEWTHSQSPILKADWFFNQTAIQAGRAAGYYDWLGVKDEKSFQALVGFDAGKHRRKVELREAISDSGVTEQPRGYARFEADEGGAYRYTLDFRIGVAGLNALRVLGQDIEDAYRDPKNVKDVASEQFGDLPNGFLASFLGNNAGVRQDSAPDFIASDGLSKSNDKRVHVNASCLRCHKNAGTQTLTAWARNLFQPPLALQDPDPHKFRVKKQQYLRALEPAQERDRQRFSAAIQEATGLDAKAYLAAYAAEWERYEDAKVDLAWAADEMYVTPDVLTKALMRQLKVTGGIDPVAGVFLHTGDRKQTIGIRQFEEVYPILQTYLRGVQ